nr:MAG TPA: shock protein B [Caudoviricetes sp.]
MKAFEVISLILNFLLASGLLGTLIFFRAKRRQANAEAAGADLENTDKIISMQTAHIGRLDHRVEKLEEKVDKLEVIIEDKDGEIGRQRYMIRQAYKCSTPPDQCPVLLKRAEIDKKLKDQNNEQRIEKP